MIANIQVAHYAGMASRDPAFEFALDVVIASIAPPLPLEVTLLHAVAKVRRAAAASQWRETERALEALYAVFPDPAVTALVGHITHKRGPEDYTRRAVLTAMEHIQSAVLRASAQLRNLPLASLEIEWPEDFPFTPLIVG